MILKNKIIPKNDSLTVTKVDGGCPCLFRIKKGFQRYEIRGATNDSGDSIIYFQVGVAEESAKKEDGSWMSDEELNKVPVNWLAGFELNSARQVEVLIEMLQGVIDKLKEREGDAE